MGLIQWAISPWGRTVPIHIAWFLIWVCAIAGLLFMIVHALYVGIFARPKKFEVNDSPAVIAAIPERVPRHSLVARAFHWVMAISMFALLITAFLPKIGIKFDWVWYHWVAGLVLTASVLFHIFHASFFLDFWSIWPDRIDIRDAKRRMMRAFGKDAPPPDRFAKYPLENKFYHAVILLAGLAVIATGLFMMKRVNTGNLCAQSLRVRRYDVGHDVCCCIGLAGVGLIALMMVHVYFGLRPETLPITKSMIFGYMEKDFYLEEHDPQRWAGDGSSPTKEGPGLATGDD